ncbi:GntR family transcriptional regulator [Gemmata sp.]|uniref:GntR family transcriptional regulator n=1 Tax=Gemmata sp. TaxID=1914242 RepID=UPI003F6EDFEC
MPKLVPVEAAFDHGLRRQSVVRAVLTDIFHGHLRAGQRLVTESLATRFGVSHTPVREALIELRGLGVVDLLPNRGGVVREVTRQNVKEVCQVRKVLECEAVRGAARSADPDRVAAVAAEVRAVAASPAGPETVARAREADNHLHDLIREACGNRFLAAELERLRTLFRTFRDVTWDLEVARRDFHRIAIEAAEHLAITDALRARDARAAVAAMTAHMRSGVMYWTQVTANLTRLPREV